jgi:PERQ amino acid-rich with GYF domain-containing protein
LQSHHLFSLTLFYSGIGEENVSFSVKTEEIADSFGKITGNASGQGTGAETFNASMAEGK